MEPWLRPNLRALSLIMIPPAVLAVLGALVAIGLGGLINATWARVLGGVVSLLSFWALMALANRRRRPRLAYEAGHMVVDLGPGAPERVPIDIVEGFLFGQGPAFLPGKKLKAAEASTLVIRLADRAEEWSRRDVNPSLGRWCDGYITIRGVWCEPLDVEVANRLNHRLVEVLREWRPVKGAS